MEEIYTPQSFGASECLSWKEYFENFENVFTTECNEFTETEYILTIKELMNCDVSFNDVIHLSASCSINNLTCESENTTEFPQELPENINSTAIFTSEILNKDTKLATTQCFSEIKKLTINPAQLLFGNKRNYQKPLEFVLPPTPPDLSIGSEYIISVLIYKPLPFKFFNAKNASEKIRFGQEVLVLGRTTLEEFRDIIACSSDFGICQEVEDTDADLSQLADAKKIYPSGYLFINNVFYNDFREPESIDYSLPILEWAKKKKIKGLSSANMGDVTFKSLKFRIGYPYLYNHQGNCEHIFVFADARLMTQDDCHHSQCYPHVVSSNRNSNIMCFMCNITFAKWIIVDSDRLPQHKMFLCTECCNSYNYINGEKIGKFKLYPFYEKHVAV